MALALSDISSFAVESNEMCENTAVPLGSDASTDKMSITEKSIRTEKTDDIESVVSKVVNNDDNDNNSEYESDSESEYKILRCGRIISALIQFFNIVIPKTTNKEYDESVYGKSLWEVFSSRFAILRFIEFPIKLTAINGFFQYIQFFYIYPLKEIQPDGLDMIIWLIVLPVGIMSLEGYFMTFLLESNFENGRFPLLHRPRWLTDKVLYISQSATIRHLVFGILFIMLFAPPYYVIMRFALPDTINIWFYIGLKGFYATLLSLPTAIFAITGFAIDVHFDRVQRIMPTQSSGICFHIQKFFWAGFA